MKFVVQTDGDRSVGINGDRAELEYDISTFDKRDQKEVVDSIRSGLMSLFGLIMDGNVRVTIPCETCGGEGETFVGQDDVGGEQYERCSDCGGSGEAI